MEKLAKDNPMEEENRCEGCRKDKLVNPPPDKFGEVVLVELEENSFERDLNEALGTARYQILGKQREYVCDKCVSERRKKEYLLLTIFYAALLILIWTINTEVYVQLLLIIGVIGTGLYFFMRDPDKDIRDQILKESLKALGQTPVTRKEAKYL